MRVENDGVASADRGIGVDAARGKRGRCPHDANACWRARVPNPPNITIEAQNNETLLLEGHRDDVLAYKAGVLLPNAGSRYYIDNATICRGSSAPADCIRRETMAVGVDVAQTVMVPANSTARVLKIIDLLYVSVRQSTVSAGRPNNLTLILNAEETLVFPYQVVTVRGLVGSATAPCCGAVGVHYKQHTHAAPRAARRRWTVEVRPQQAECAVSCEISRSTARSDRWRWVFEVRCTSRRHRWPVGPQ